MSSTCNTSGLWVDRLELLRLSKDFIRIAKEQKAKEYAEYLTNVKEYLELWNKSWLCRFIPWNKPYSLKDEDIEAVILKGLPRLPTEPYYRPDVHAREHCSYANKFIEMCKFTHEDKVFVSVLDLNKLLRKVSLYE